MADEKVLPPPPLQTQVLGANGLMSQTWVLWVQKLNLRVGGSYSDSLGTVNTSITTLQTSVIALQASETAQSASIAAIQAQIAALQAVVADLQAKLAAGITATVTTAALSVGGSQGSMTFVNGVLIAEVQST